ncbi:uncharacterized protein I206_107482 [Kwoniella pini CBS 10737]|uniref:Uncharacterized protein n=1 Tax=Kwoniella pini CBS 10737 TaxID=1296096 RepID=A0A1B9HXF2_9TREE|nr:uncharacterized protein I206_05811 [Kwoniella pini CBS 10737]OCF47946.1 hypothetical protein I206_05811 [Kwoniella pini CBS 10737]
MSIQKQYKFTKSTLPIPFDILYIIIQNLYSSKSFKSLSKLAQLSKEYNNLIIPLIYKDIHLKSDEQLQLFLLTNYYSSNLQQQQKEEEEIKNKKTSYKIKNALNLNVKKKVRSNSLKFNYNNNNKQQKQNKKIFNDDKLNNLNLIKTFKIDFYPSRLSFKLSSSLLNNNPLKIEKLIFTSNSLIDLNEKLKKSNSPKILTFYWSKHLPNLFKPNKILIDFKNLDITDLMLNENWLNTITGFNISIQSWKNNNYSNNNNNNLKEIILKGENWFGILPNPGIKISIKYNKFNYLNSEEEDNNLENLKENNNNNNINLIEKIQNRNKIIEKRTKSLIKGLRNSQALHENYQSNSSLNWEIIDILPNPIITNININEEERFIENQREKRKVLDDILTELDQVSPYITKRYGIIGLDGRRELSCLNWVESF